MRILVVSYSDGGGGAAIAALRLVRALCECGHDAVLGVYQKRTCDNCVIEIPRINTFPGRLRRAFFRKWERWLLRGFKTKNSVLHSLNSFSLVDVDWINDYPCDVVNLHWVNHNTLSIRDIARIRKPVVWTMHDAWAFCGAEHAVDVLNGDERYRIGYAGTKPDSSSGLDIPRMVFDRKMKYWKSSNMHFIAPSKWQAALFEDSALRRAHSEWECSVIPNVVAATEYFPFGKLEARKALGIDADSIMIGFGSAYQISKAPSLKGGHLLISALKELRCKWPERKYALLVIGETDPGFAQAVEMPVISTGMLTSERLQRILYNSCDVFVCPSIVESFGLMALEAMACGVPVAAFGVAGILDIVEHKRTGYLAKPYDPGSLCEAIEWCAENAEAAGSECVSRFRRSFGTADIVGKHIESYSRRVSCQR